MSRDLPVDDWRGASFYDHSFKFQRINFLNLFDNLEDAEQALEQGTAEDAVKKILIKNIKEEALAKVDEVNEVIRFANEASVKRKTEDKKKKWPGAKTPAPSRKYDGECKYTKEETVISEYETKVEWTEKCEWTEEVDDKDEEKQKKGKAIKTEKKYVKFYGTAKSLDKGLFQQALEKMDLDKLAEEMIWLEKDPEEKNFEAWQNALDGEEGGEFFWKDSSSYEFSEIKGEGIADNGLKVSFTGGGSAEFDFEFEKEKIANLNFDFETEKDGKKFLGEDLAELTGKYDVDEKCPASNLLGILDSFSCAVENFEDNQGSTIVMDAETGEMQVYSGFDENSEAVDEVKTMKVSPDSISIFKDNRGMITIEVELLNSLNKVVESDYSTKVSLVADNDFLKNFKVSDTEKTASSGNVKFFVTPKSDISGKSFSFKVSAKAGGQTISAESIPLKLLDYSILVTKDKEKIAAKDLDGVEIVAKLLDENGELSYDLDGQDFEFRSVWGSFTKGREVKIDKGQAKNIFVPSRAVGDAEITVSDAAGLAEDEIEKLDILASDASKIVFETSQKYLVDGGDYTKIVAQVQDEYGNLVDDIEHQISWELTDLEADGLVKDENNQMNGIQQNLKGGEGVIYVKPVDGKQVSQIIVSSDLLGNRFTENKQFKILKEPDLVFSSKTTDFSVEDEKEYTVIITAQDKDGKKIDADFTVNLYSDENVGTFPAQVELKDGRGSFSFLPGINAGRGKIYGTALGFEKGEFVFATSAGQAAKVLISAGQELFGFG